MKQDDPKPKRDLFAVLDDLISEDDECAEAAAQQIAEWGEAAIPPLLELFGASDPDHRWWAVRTLTQFNRPEAKAAIRQALTDSVPAVRQCAALGLRERPSADAIPSLIDSLRDHDRFFARLAADALTATGDLAAPALIEAMKSQDVHVRIEAARALAIMHNQQAIPALFNALDDPSPWVIYWAEEGLRNLGMDMVFFEA